MKQIERGMVDYGERRSGRTTRIIDQCVQDFFKDGFAYCLDHYPSEDMNKYVQERVFKRLLFEHRNLENEGVGKLCYRGEYLVVLKGFEEKAKDWLLKNVLHERGY